MSVAQLWAGDSGESAKYWLHVLSQAEEPPLPTPLDLVLGDQPPAEATQLDLPSVRCRSQLGDPRGGTAERTPTGSAPLLIICPT